MERLRLLLTAGGRRSLWLWAGPLAGALATLVAAFLIMPDVSIVAKLPIALVMSTYMVVQAGLYLWRDDSSPGDDGPGRAPQPLPDPKPPVLVVRIASSDRPERAPRRERELEPAGRR
jgi:hypothetical protein